MSLTLRKSIAVALAIVYSATQIVFASAPESNFWAERRRSTAERQDSSVQFASLPSSLNPNVASRNLINQLPSISGNLPVDSKWTNLKTKSAPGLSKKFRDLVDSIPLIYGAIQDVYDSGNDQMPPVVLVQDVHLNTEAQTNIASVLQELIDQKQVGLVGVEGAFGAFDFKQFRKYPNKEISKEVVEDLLNKNLLAAPSFVGITSPAEPPKFLGVDDKEHYEANLEALYSSRDQKSEVDRQVDGIKQSLRNAKVKFFSKELSDFDQLRGAHHKGDISFGSYVKKLAAYGTDSDFVIQQFLEAYGMESNLDFKRVESERRTVIEKLTKALNEKEISNLVAQSLAYRMGRVGFGAYYQGIRDLCDKKGVRLSQTPNFENYIRYVLLSDSIKADSLFNAVEKMEQDIVSNLARSPEERSLSHLSDLVSLIDKLLDFSLTPNEWEKYSKNRQTLSDISLALSALLGSPSPRTINASLESFEAFYKEADIRSHKMVEKLVEHSTTGPRALVLGGFHSPQVAQILRKEKISYVIVSPKLTKIDATSGSSYLSVFAREKTPLDRLFAGEKLFVYPEHLAVGTTSRATNLMNLLLVAVLSIIPGNSVDKGPRSQEVIYERNSYTVRYTPNEASAPGLHLGPTTITQEKSLGSSVASIFHGRYLKSLIQTPTTIWGKILAWMGRPFVGAPLWEWIFQAPVVAGAAFGIGFPYLVVIGLIFSVAFGFSHRDKTTKQKLVLVGVGILFSLASILPLFIMGPSTMSIVFGLPANILSHVVYNFIAPLIGAPLASINEQDDIIRNTPDFVRLPGGWRYSPNARNYGEHTQGWKFHVILTEKDAGRVLQVIIPILMELDIGHKVADGMGRLQKRIAAGGTQAGKGMAIYFSEEDAIRIGTKLGLDKLAKRSGRDLYEVVAIYLGMRMDSALREAGIGSAENLDWDLEGRNGDKRFGGESSTGRIGYRYGRFDDGGYDVNLPNGDVAWDDRGRYKPEGIVQSLRNVKDLFPDVDRSERNLEVDNSLRKSVDEIATKSSGNVGQKPIEANVPPRFISIQETTAAREAFKKTVGRHPNVKELGAIVSEATRSGRSLEDVANDHANQLSPKASAPLQGSLAVTDQQIEDYFNDKTPREDLTDQILDAVEGFINQQIANAKSPKEKGELEEFYAGHRQKIKEDRQYIANFNNTDWLDRQIQNDEAKFSSANERMRATIEKRIGRYKAQRERIAIGKATTTGATEKPANDSIEQSSNDSFRIVDLSEAPNMDGATEISEIDLSQLPPGALVYIDTGRYSFVLRVEANGKLSVWTAVAGLTGRALGSLNGIGSLKTIMASDRGGVFAVGDSAIFPIFKFGETTSVEGSRATKVQRIQVLLPVVPASIINPMISWLRNYSWGKPIYVLLTVVGASIWETYVFQNHGFVNLTKYFVGHGLDSSLSAALGIAGIGIAFAFAHTIITWLARVKKDGWRNAFTAEALRGDARDFGVRTGLSMGFTLPFLFLDPITASIVAVIAHSLYNAAVLAGLLPKGSPVASIFDKLKALLGGGTSEEIPQDLVGKKSSIGALRTRFERAIAHQDVPEIQRIITDAGRLPRSSDAVEILLQIAQLNLVPVITAAVRELDRVLRNHPDAKTGQVERTLTRIASTLQSSGYRNEAQFISGVANSVPGVQPATGREAPSSALTPKAGRNTNGLPQFETYLDGLREGRAAHSLEMSGTEAAQELGFGSGFAELYDRLSQRVKERLRSSGRITIEQVIALAESVVKEAEARRTTPSPTSSTSDRGERTPPDEVKAGQRESDQSEHGPAPTRIINPADQSTSAEQSIVVDEFSRVRTYQATPAAETRLIENFLAAYSEFVVALSRGNGNGARASMVSSARAIDPVLARAVENLARISQSDLWSNGEAVLREAKAINEYLISKGYYLYANVISDGRKALYMSTYYRIVEARLYAKNGSKVAAIHLERLDKLNIDEARLGHSAGDGLAVVMRDKIRTNVLNTVLPGLGQAIDASWDVDLPSSLMASASRLIEQDLLQILTTSEMARARSLGDLLGQRARLMRKLNALLKPYGAGIYSHSLELLLNAETLSAIQQWSSQIGQGNLARDITRINREISAGKNDYEPIVEKIIAASARSVEIHELTHEFDRDRTRVEPVAYSNQLALSPTFGIDLVHLMQHVIRPMGRDENEAAATILRGLGAQLLGTRSVLNIQQIEKLFASVRDLAAEERGTVQTRSHEREFGPLLVTVADVQKARTLASIIDPLISWLRVYSWGKPIYAILTVLGASIWETYVFQNHGFANITDFFISNGLDSSLSALLGVAGIGIIFAFTHTIITWLARVKKNGLQNAFSAELLKGDAKDFGIRTGLSVGFTIPFLFLDPITASIVTIILHGLYNSGVLTEILPRWMPIASIFNSEKRRQTKSSASPTSEHAQSSPADEIASKLITLLITPRKDRKVLADAIFNLVDTEKVFGENFKEGAANRSAQWRDIAKALNAELARLVEREDFNTIETSARLADLTFILHFVLTDKEYRGFIGSLNDVPVRNKNTEARGFVSWVSNLDQVKQLTGALRPKDRQVIGVDRENDKLIGQLAKEYGFSVQELNDKGRLQIIGGKVEIVLGDKSTNAASLIRIAQGAALFIKGASPVLNLLILDKTSLPIGFFQMSDAELAFLKREAYVYFVNETLQAIEVDASLLPDWNILRARLIQA